jgi:hypothetical protein
LGASRRAVHADRLFERAFNLLHRPLKGAEREELYWVFLRVGSGLGIPDLKATYTEWQQDRERHLEHDLTPSPLTRELYARYRQQLGPWRFRLLPKHVAELLDMSPASWLRRAIPFYRSLVRVGLRPLIRGALLPTRYIPEVRRLDQAIPI